MNTSPFSDAVAMVEEEFVERQKSGSDDQHARWGGQRDGAVSRWRSYESANLSIEKSQPNPFRSRPMVSLEHCSSRHRQEVLMLCLDCLSSIPVIYTTGRAPGGGRGCEVALFRRYMRMGSPKVRLIWATMTEKPDETALSRTIWHRVVSRTRGRRRRVLR